MIRILSAWAGGCGISFLLILGNNVASIVYPQLINFFYLSVFWSVGLFSIFFDKALGMHSVWIPNPFAFIASFALSSLIYSVPIYIFLSRSLDTNETVHHSEMIERTPIVGHVSASSTTY